MPAPSAASDRNLLLGVLALQLTFIDRDGLVAALHAWVLDREKPLGQILQEQGKLPPLRRTMLEGLVEEHLRAHGGSPAASLEGLSSVRSTWQALGQVADPDVQSLTRVDGPRAGDAKWITPPPPSPTTSRYLRLRPHARGGLGEVFLALDTELHRQVALKEIQDEHADRPKSRQRFVLEAEITGNLEHPGIVPVYGLGSYPDGRPFYAMRFIKGDNLMEAIRRFHAGGPADFGGLAFRGLLRRFIDVCNAIAYAHSRGVLHRDLKPQNVMLGRYGETLVVDWGLARPTAGPEGALAGSDEPVVVNSPGNESATLTGEAVGTPAFMSPEQAAGRLDRLGPASDVYGLGATLYALLTGRAPFQGDVAEVLVRVERGDCPPAWRANPRVPAALDAVCRKAMAVEPANRYPTALALAQDVEHWLAGEPVTAYAEPLAARAARWVRRHRVLAAATAAGVVVALVLGSAVGVWWWQHQERQRLARQERQQRSAASAEAAIEQAAQLRSRMRWKEAGLLLRQAGDAVAEAEDERLAEAFRQAGADLTLAQELDRVREEASALVAGRWDPGRVRERYPEVLRRHGLDVLDGPVEVVAQRIGQSAVRTEILACLDGWVVVVEAKQQRRLLELGWRVDPGNRWRQRLLEPGVLGVPERRRALLGQLMEGRLAPQTALFVGDLLGEGEEALGLLARVRERHPDDFWLNFTLGTRLAVPKERYNKERDSTKQEEAIGYYRAALAIKPDSSATHSNLGVALHGKGDLEGAIRSYRAAIRLEPRLVKAHVNLGNALRDKEDVEGAIRCYHEAIRLDPRYADAHVNLGNALNARGDVEGAKRSYHEAIRLDPGSTLGHYNLAVALRDRGDVEGAIRSYREVVRLDPRHVLAHYNLGVALHGKGDVEGAIRSYRAATRFDPKFAKAHLNLGAALRDKGDVEGAIQSHQEAIRIDPRYTLAHYSLGLALSDKGDLEDAIRSLRTAIGLDPRFARAHGILGAALLRQGHFRTAQQSLQRCQQLLPPSDPLQRPTAQFLQQCQQGLDLEPRLEAVLRGQPAPAEAALTAQLAALAQLPAHEKYAAAANLYALALARDQRLAPQHRYNAARAAAQAGCGQGKDAATLNADGRLRWRRQALTWLRAELNRQAGQMKGWWPGAANQARQAVTRWRTDRDLACVRDREALARLPAEERHAWTQFWAEVDALVNTQPRARET
jgi:tetratricopeptide (TPR) repeat protein/tRNA A-37 threonylcarbamoyl transferase component Bud32